MIFTIIFIWQYLVTLFVLYILNQDFLYIVYCFYYIRIQFYTV